MTKATHQGTCQICGNLQKLPNGALSNHGYTIDFGYFNGVCTGAHGKPFEQSCDLIEQSIANVNEYIKTLNTQITELKTTTAFVWINATTKIGKYKTTRNWLKVDQADLIIDGNKITVDLCRGDHDTLNQGRTATIGQYAYDLTVDQKIIEQNVFYILTLENEIEKANTYVAWQSDRVANWKPGKLVAIKKESNEPVMHFEAVRYNRQSAMCKYSAQAAQTFNGHTTTDETKVSCKRCLKAIEEMKVNYSKSDDSKKQKLRAKYPTIKF